MSDTHKSSGFPRAKLKRGAALSLIWLIPLLAAIAAAILVFHQVRKLGPEITIQFADGSGLEPNQTLVRYRGVRVGSVNSVRISKDNRHVEVEARLDRSAEQLAREGTIFWIVRPQVGAGGIHALETIVSGPYIQAQPGNANGKEKTSFVGANDPPVVKPSDGGKEFILRSPGLGSLSQGSPVFYRGVEVGAVQYLSLSRDSTMVEVHVLIKDNFASLVRTNTVWWNAGGINVDLYFFGLSLNAQNLKSLVVGGISFATPDHAGQIADTGTVFTLFEKAEPQWLTWAPAISITNAKAVSATENNSPQMQLNRGDQSQQQ